MDASVLKFSFQPSVSMGEVESTLQLAMLAAECLHGEDRVRLEARAKLDTAGRTCVADVTTEVGRTFALVFGGFVRREFGEQAVRVSRLEPALNSRTAGAA